MGDMADMALDEMMDYDELYINNELDDEYSAVCGGRTIYRQPPIEKPPFDGPYTVVKRMTATCKYCHQNELEWFQLRNGEWRLRTRYGKTHKCLKKSV